MSSRFVIHHDLDGTWSVREKKTGHPALFRGNPVMGLSEKAAGVRARRLNASVSVEATPMTEEELATPMTEEELATPMTEEELQDLLRPSVPHRVWRPAKRLRGRS